MKLRSICRARWLKIVQKNCSSILDNTMAAIEWRLECGVELQRIRLSELQALNFETLNVGLGAQFVRRTLQNSSRLEGQFQTECNEFRQNHIMNEKSKL